MLSNIFYIAIGVFALGFSIFIHELGHFLAAKKRGLIANRFSIGMGPRLFGFNWKGTDFRVSLFPIGGYVALPQLADMGRLEGGEETAPQDLPPISYADKVIVSIMGVVCSIIFAFCLSLILWIVGRDMIVSTEINTVNEQLVDDAGVTVPGPAYVAGLRSGDRVLSIDGKTIRSWREIDTIIMTGTQRDAEGRPMAEVEILRDGTKQLITVNPILIDLGIDSGRSIGIGPGTDLVILEVQKDMPALAAGLQKGDKIVALDDIRPVSSGLLQTYLSQHTDGAVNLTIERAGQEIVVSIEPQIALGETKPRFGFSYEYDYTTERVHLNPLEQLNSMFRIMQLTLVALFSPKSDVDISGMSGPIGIVHGLTNLARYSFIDLLWFLGVININLAILNILPIPVLDGGHIVFATFQKLFRRPVPSWVINWSYAFCIAGLLTLMAYLSYRDVLRVGLDAGLVEDKPNATAPASTPAIEPAKASEDAPATP